MFSGPMSRLGILCLLLVCSYADATQLHQHALPCESHPETAICAGSLCLDHTEQVPQEMHPCPPVLRERSGYSLQVRSDATAGFFFLPPVVDRSNESFSQSVSFYPAQVIFTSSLHVRAPPAIG